MKIQVLGSGCSACKKLFEIAKQAAKELAIKNEVEYITDIQQILNMGLISGPVLVVDGKPAFVGFVPNIEEIKKAIKKVTTKQ